MDADWSTSLEGMHVDGEKPRSEGVGHMFIFLFSFSIGNVKSLIYNIMSFTLCCFIIRRSVMSFLCCLYLYLFFYLFIPDFFFFFDALICEPIVLS